MRFRSILLIALLLACTGPSAQAGNQAAVAVTVVGARAGAPITHAFSLTVLAKLPQATRSVRLHSGHGDDSAIWSGPLLWGVLVDAGVVDPAEPGAQVPQVVRVTGADGYQAALALGEISPAFAGHKVLLALRRDGTALPGGHPRLIAG
jgi:hypothetical protein